MFSWPSLHERMCRTWGSNSGPLAAPIAQLVECPLRGTGGHGFDPGPRHTKVVKNGISCSYKSEHWAPCRNQTPSWYDWKIVESDVKPEYTHTRMPSEHVFHWKTYNNDKLFKPWGKVHLYPAEVLDVPPIYVVVVCPYLTSLSTIF